jgi:O-antigen ligase
LVHQSPHQALIIPVARVDHIPNVDDSSERALGLRLPIVRRWLFPVATAALVMSGDFKDIPALGSLPIDLTFLCATVVAAAVAVQLIRRPIHPEVFTVAVGFGLLLPSVFISASTDYGSYKILRLFTLTLLSALAPIVGIESTHDIEKHLWAWTGISGIVAASALVNPQASAAEPGAPITAAGVDTIGLGQAAGLVVVSMMMGTAWKRVPGFIAVPLGGGALYALLQSGSRGPLFSTLLALAAGTVLARSRPKLARTAMLALLCTVGVVAAFAAAPFGAQRRIMAVLEGRTVGTTVEIRGSLYDIALKSIAEHPFGIGWGNYEKIAFANYTYPHDLYLEILAEAGIVFGGFFLLWIAVYTWRARYATVSHAGGVVLALLVLMVGFASFSGDINDNRTLFYTLGLGIAARAVVTREEVRRCPTDLQALADSPLRAPTAPRGPSTS